jgi:hypothetical protein
MTQIAVPEVGLPPAAVHHTEALLSDSLRQAIIRTVAYSDVFDFALTRGELHRFLIGVGCTHQELAAALDSGAVDDHVSIRGDLVAVRGREDLFALRQGRDRTSARLWPAARRLGRAIASLPFVRMVAVTGGLAAGNAIDGDIDLLVVTRAGRLWLTRAAAIAIVRFAARQGWELCPNYFLAETALELHDHDLYAASELVRMVPIAGLGAYSRFRALNTWTASWFPNAPGPPIIANAMPPLMTSLRAAAEGVLALPPAGLAEAWEQRRKVARFRAQARAAGGLDDEAAFGPDRCKGHFDSHRSRIRGEYEARVGAAGVEPLW